MNSRQRVKLALDHKEADRIPFDLGGTVLTSIHVNAYRNLRRYLGLPDKEVAGDGRLPADRGGGRRRAPAAGL